MNHPGFVQEDHGPGRAIGSLVWMLAVEPVNNHQKILF